MAITFSCSCGRKINAKDEHAGKRVKCPACQQVLTVPHATAKAPAIAAAAGAKPAAPRTKPASAPKPAPVDDDMYDIKEDAPPPKKKAGGSAPASPWGDDDPGLDAPVAAPRPYMPMSGAPGAAPARGKTTAAATAGAAPAAAGAIGAFAQLGSKRGSSSGPQGNKVTSGFHLGGFAKFIIAAAIVIPLSIWIIKTGPVQAVADWEKAGPAGEDDVRSVVGRVIHDMDAATMPPPDPDRDNKDGIPYHPEVTHFYYPDEPTVMWRMPDKVVFQGSTTFGKYEGVYYTRKRLVECDMEWKGSDNLKVVGQCAPQGGVQKVTVDGIDTTDVMAIAKKFDGYPAWSTPSAKQTIGKVGGGAGKK
jgi:hypothetical protein